MTDLAQRVLAGDQRALSQMLSSVERGDPEAAQVMRAGARCHSSSELA